MNQNKNKPAPKPAREPERQAVSLGLRHVALNVRDTQVSKRFYADLFGMEVAWEPDGQNVYLTSAGQDNLALHEKKGLHPDWTRQALDHLGFMMATKEAVATLHQRAKEKNIPIVKPLKEHRDGAYSFYLKDPDGYVVQVIYHPLVAAKKRDLPA